MHEQFYLIPTSQVAYKAHTIVKLENIFLELGTCHIYEQDGWIYEVYKDSKLSLDLPRNNKRQPHTMSSLYPKQITGIPDPMDTTQDQANPLDRISEVTSPASVASSTEGPIHSDRVQRRVGSPYPTGKGPGSRIYNQGSSRRQGSPRPGDDHATFLLALAKRAEIALQHLNGKITTNQVTTEDLNEQIQGQVQEIQDLQQEVNEGKQLDSEKALAFEAVIIAVENATVAR